MRKLTKSNVEELRKEMPVLTSGEEREVIGGTGITSIRIRGGILLAMTMEVLVDNIRSIALIMVGKRLCLMGSRLLMEI